MIVLDSEFLVCVDIDNTLIMYEPTFEGQEAIVFYDSYDQVNVEAYPHIDHIRLLKRCKAKGMQVIVWSKAGRLWAKEVVDVLRLEKFVDIITTKPIFYVDDKLCSEWMGHREYLEERWGF